MPRPDTVAIQPPRRRAVVHAEAEQAAHLPLLAGVRHLDDEFHPAVQVAVHQVRAAHPDLGLIILPGPERVHPGVLKIAPEYAADPDVLRQPGDAGPHRAHPADPQVDRHAGLGRAVERVGDDLVDDRVALELDPGGLARTLSRRLPADPPDEAPAQGLGRDQQPVVGVLAAVPGEVVEQVGDVLAHFLGRGEQPEVLVQPRRRRMVVPGAEMAVAP
jgi:hypothetical protein